jgi:Predicted membrane protein (DUF2207)
MNARSLLPRVCALALLAALPAAARQIVIKNFDEQVVVNRNSTVDVTEKIEAQFIGTGWHGIYRTIPVEYRGSAGLNYTLFLDDLRATDDEGNSLKLERSRVGNDARFKIYVPEADNSTRTIVLHYRVLDGLRFFPDHDEFYWNVTGEEWDAPIESASARIELPEGASGLRATAYTGVFNSRGQDANVTTNDNVVEIYTTRQLGYHQGLTAVVGFDKGLVHEPTLSDDIALFLRSNWPIFVIPVVVFAIMFWLWWTRGRDPERDAITVEYEPPDKLTPAECGTLVDNEAAMRDITATLVDLAVKGYILIEQKDQSGLLGLTHHRDYVFHLKKPPAEWTDLRAHERAMLGGLFYGGDSILTASAPVSSRPTASPGMQDYSLESGAVLSDSAPAAVAAPPIVEDYSVAFRGASNFGDAPQESVALSQLQNRFYQQLPSIRDCIFDALIQDGYYLHRPDTVRQGYIGGGLVIGFMIIALGNWWAKQSGMSPATWTMAGILAGAIICGFGWFMPARTITGARTLAKVLGFEDFLSRVESDRIKRLENAPALFEKFLPYAMALRVEKKWVQAFSGIAMQPPEWYQGGVYGAGFQPYFLVNDLNMMSTQAGTVMASSPRSSGSSGFGGGGGAGGGFGGGGGGGF